MAGGTSITGAMVAVPHATGARRVNYLVGRLPSALGGVGPDRGTREAGLDENIPIKK